MPLSWRPVTLRHAGRVAGEETTRAAGGAGLRQSWVSPGLALAGTPVRRRPATAPPNGRVAAHLSQIGRGDGASQPSPRWRCSGSAVGGERVVLAGVLQLGHDERAGSADCEGYAEASGGVVAGGKRP